MTVAEDKNILTEDERSSSAFSAFQTRLQEAVDTVARAMGATSQRDAEILWRRAFNE